MITNTFETDPSELRDLVNFKSILYFLVVGLLPSLFVFKVELKKLTLKTQFLQRLKYFIVLIVFFVVVVLSFSKHYTSFARENRDLRLYINPTYYLYSAAKFIDSKIATSSTPFKVIGLDAQINKKSDKRRLVVFVIGETVRRDHMSINGYDLQTNPYLEKEEVISFKNVFFIRP
jgi:lipid A ethanolaminephosphotransferase